MDLTNEERSTLNGFADQVLSKGEVSMRQLATRIRDVLPTPPSNGDQTILS
jgi:hypothetical protein